MSPFPLLPSLALLLALPALQATPPQEPSPEPGRDWQRLIARDERISFTRRTEHDARADLQREDLTPLERATVLMALGCARPEAIRERPTLESWAREGTPVERRAAILALGELGVGVEGLLYELVEDPDFEIRGAAMLALLGTGRSSAREELDGIAAGTGPDAELAAALLVYSVDPSVSKPNEVVSTRLHLRWEAARRYGLVDGQSWSARVLADLVKNQEFLDRVVLRAAAERDEHGVRDHLLSTLLETGSLPAVQAATRAMPAELAALISNDLWVPAGPRVWQLIVDEIEDGGLENEALELLGLALEEPLVQAHALLLLSRAGIVEPLVGIENDWQGFSDVERIRIAEALGILGTEDAAIWLAQFEEQHEATVRAATRIARARLGDQDAYDEQRAILLDPRHPEFRPSMAVALRLLDVKFIREELEEVLIDLEGLDLIRVATELTLRGDLQAREILRDAVRDGLPPGRLGARVVRALIGRDAAGEIELFRKFFPVEDDLEVNVQLALALIEAKDDQALLVLRPALWSDPFDRSVLSGLLVIGVVGIHGLRDELYRAPLTASARDFRRLGYALGEWGGLEEVVFLQERAGLLAGRPILQGAVLGALGRRTH